VESQVTEDLEPGRPAVEAVFVALVVTTVAGAAFVQLLARFLPPPAANAGPVASVLTATVAGVSVAFAIAQAILPGPRSAGCFGLAIPMVGAIALAFRGLEPAAVVAALFAGVFLTPAAYYLAIRFSIRLGGFARRRPFTALVAAALGTLFLVQALRMITHLADPAIDWRILR
jgi:hypothetical protein